MFFFKEPLMECKKQERESKIDQIFIKRDQSDKFYDVFDVDLSLINQIINFNCETVVTLKVNRMSEIEKDFRITAWIDNNEASYAKGYFINGHVAIDKLRTEKEYRENNIAGGLIKLLILFSMRFGDDRFLYVNAVACVKHDKQDDNREKLKKYNEKQNKLEEFYKKRGVYNCGPSPVDYANRNDTPPQEVLDNLRLIKNTFIEHLDL